MSLLKAPAVLILMIVDYKTKTIVSGNPDNPLPYHSQREIEKA